MNRRMLQTAKALKPRLCHENIFLERRERLKEGDSAVFDFGSHYVGYLTVNLSSVGSPQDAPAFIKFKFCEIAPEIDEDTANYQGWISKSWLQEEWVHVDVLPCKLKLPRRYAFRYVKIEVIGLSSKFDLVINSLALDSVTSAPEEVKLCGSSEKERAIDRVALRTLRECMQYEFEDGPKRDKRLWLGDLRLQALANYQTYRHNDLVKRCLYLFAGTADKNGKISACVFTQPKVIADDTFTFDYSLLFIPTLYDYVCATNDLQVGEELYPIAVKQLELAKKHFDGDLICDSDVLGWCFLDWNLYLNKQCGAQAVYIYSAKSAVALAKLLGKDTKQLECDIENKSKAMLDKLYDEKSGLFVSGKDRQISYASNVWACLAQVLSNDENAKLLERLEGSDAVKPVTPYMYHHYIQVLIDCGLQQKARAVMNEYWGAMVEMGADTFFELFDPANPEESPYGNKAVNSYCHAWSCTPSYFLRKYFER